MAKRFDMAQKEVMMKFLLYDQLQQLVHSQAKRMAS
jgi:hypothetical protein